MQAVVVVARRTAELVDKVVKAVAAQVPQVAHITMRWEQILIKRNLVELIPVVAAAARHMVVMEVLVQVEVAL